MRRNKIQDRTDLAKHIKKPYPTVARQINADWSGHITTTGVLTAICRTFNVPMSSIVHEPRETR